MQMGPGVLTLTGSNSYTGGSSVSGGTLDVASPAALPSIGIVNVGLPGSVDLTSLLAGYLLSIPDTGMDSDAGTDQAAPSDGSGDSFSDASATLGTADLAPSGTSAGPRFDAGFLSGGVTPGRAYRSLPRWSFWPSVVSGCSAMGGGGDRGGRKSTSTRAGSLVAAHKGLPTASAIQNGGRPRKKQN